MKNSILLVTKRLERSPTGGRELLCKFKYETLLDIYQERLTLFEIAPSPALGGGARMNALRGYIDGLNLRTLDVVLDSVPGDPGHIERSLSALKEGGRLISLLTFFDDAFKAKLKSRNVFGHRFGVVSDGDAMGVIAGWLEKSVLKSHVSGAFSFEDLPQTHRQVETGKTRGKIVVILD